MAYWQGGKCILHGSNQSHTAAVPNIARLIGIKPEDLVLVAEFCGGGFGSKIPGYPNMAIAALMSKKINRPVMHRISRIEEYGIGSARPSFQGHVKLGFARRRQACSPPTSTSCRKTARTSAAAISAPPATRSRWSISRQAMRWRAVPVLTNTPPVGPQRGPGENQFVAVFEPMIDKAARELGIDRLAIREHQCAGVLKQDRLRPRPAHQRLPEGRARQGRGDVQLGRTQESGPASATAPR